MEKQHNFVDHRKTANQWIRDGWAIVGDKVKLNTLKVGDFFLKDGYIFFINVTSKAYISYYSIIMEEHSTSNTEQLVHTIKLMGVQEK